MSERLIIHNFAGITELDIEIKAINIIIGPQASGKSVCAKLLFYFKSFVGDLVSWIESGNDMEYFSQRTKERFQDFFPIQYWHQNFNLRYEANNTFIQVNYDGQEIKLTYSNSYVSLAEDLKRVFQENLDFSHPLKSNGEQNTTHLKMLDCVASSIQLESSFSQLFIPAARSFFYTLQRNIFTMTSNKILVDPFLVKFGAMYESVKAYYSSPRYVKNIGARDDIRRNAEEVICGSYLLERGEEFLISNDGRKTPLLYASSGQQEALPLLLVLSVLSENRDPFDKGKTIYIEEPEAHLFPLAQKKIVEIIAMVFNSCEGATQFFITTHSPYVLAALNNLIEGGLLYEELSEEVQENLALILPRYKALNSRQMQVLSLENGQCRSIISEETGLIDATIIDQVSEELSIEFDQLLDLVDIK